MFLSSFVAAGAFRPGWDRSANQGKGRHARKTIMRSSGRGVCTAPAIRARVLCGNARGATVRNCARWARFQRAVEERAIERFIECGDPHHGFSLIYCDACGHDYLLAFSCKTRYFCPSCHQKRVLLYGEWVEETVLTPVPHRQYVFTLPRLLRHFFARRREWLGELCRIAERLLSHAYAAALPGGRPALIVFVQTFGDLVNFNPHLHVLAADGAFLPNGRFVALPRVPASLLAEGFRRAVLDFLVENEALSRELRARMLAWRHGASRRTMR